MYKYYQNVNTRTTLNKAFLFMMTYVFISFYMNFVSINCYFIIFLWWNSNLVTVLHIKIFLFDLMYLIFILLILFVLGWSHDSSGDDNDDDGDSNNNVVLMNWVNEMRTWQEPLYISYSRRTDDRQWRLLCASIAPF